MYRRPPICDLQPPHAFGGHSFLYLEMGTRGYPFLRCTRCYGILAAYELREGFMANVIGPWCPDALVALEEPAVKQVCEYCKGVINARPAAMERTLLIHLESCPRGPVIHKKPRNLPDVAGSPRKRIIPRQKL